jgi:hypothetical protein
LLRNGPSHRKSRFPAALRPSLGTLQSIPGGQGRWGAAPNPTTAAQPLQSRRSVYLEQGFEATRLNTGTMTDLATLAATLLSNFRTVHIPSSGHLEGRPGDWWAKATARRADSRAACACRDRLRRLLVEHGHHRFLHHLEPDPNGGWLLHIFAANNAVLALLDEVAEGECGPGDPVKFDPNEFVSARLRHLVANDINSS